MAPSSATITSDRRSRPRTDLAPSTKHPSHHLGAMDERSVAVLIDADNAQAKLITDVLEEAGRHGRLTVRRIYGNWTTGQLGPWKSILHEHAITPVQQFNYTSGKNATDAAMIIDAMDLLHRGSADVFCLISSDSDFTPLASRLREEGRFVVGMGERRTPTAFVHACDQFTFLENLGPQPAARSRSRRGKGKAGSAAAGGGAGGAAAATDNELAELEPLISKAYDASETDDGYAFLGAMGETLRRLDPSFDPRSYGHRKLRDLLNSLKPAFVVDRLEENVLIVRRKD